ncbi:hypothetical protein G6F44_012528 [Rhizopus delemar]|nr:hypothetical protein G6F44_012528 [Rhizopus delemar]
MNAFQNHAIRLACPSCTELFEQRQELLAHINQHRDFLEVARDASWIVKSENVSERFQQFRRHCIENSGKYVDVDRFFNHLLSISSILVVQKRNKYESIPSSYFPPSLLKDLYDETVKRLDFKKKIQSLQIIMSVKDTLEQLKNGEIETLDARIALLTLAKSTLDPTRSVILAVEAILPAIRDLDIEAISEHHLAASYIHPFIQGLFSSSRSNVVSHCSNTRLIDNENTDKRPDYQIDVYDQYCFSYTTSIGEIKIKNTTNRLKIVDFYRLATLAKETSRKHNLNGVICFQAIGGTLHFFYMTEQCGIWTFLELPSVTIPLIMNDLTSIVTYLDDLLSVKELHEKIKRESEPRPPSPGQQFPFDLVQTSRATLPKKRKSSLTLTYH